MIYTVDKKRNLQNYTDKRVSVQLVQLIVIHYPRLITIPGKMNRLALALGEDVFPDIS